MSSETKGFHAPLTPYPIPTFEVRQSEYYICYTPDVFQILTVLILFRPLSSLHVALFVVNIFNVWPRTGHPPSLVEQCWELFVFTYQQWVQDLWAEENASVRQMLFVTSNSCQGMRENSFISGKAAETTSHRMNKKTCILMIDLINNNFMNVNRDRSQ